jgi:hypothetical protein
MAKQSVAWLAAEPAGRVRSNVQELHITSLNSLQMLEAPMAGDGA